MTWAIACFVLGTLGVVQAGRLAVGDHRFDRRCRPVRGTVTGLRESTPGRPRVQAAPRRQKVVYAVTVRFELPEGRTVDAEAFEAVAEAPGVGEPVDVVYDPERPTRCRLAGRARDRRLAVLAIFALGVFFLAAGVVSVFSA